MGNVPDLPRLRSFFLPAVYPSCPNVCPVRYDSLLFAAYCAVQVAPGLLVSNHTGPHEAQAFKDDRRPDQRPANDSGVYAASDHSRPQGPTVDVQILNRRR
jgi:hypothetical protein